MGWHAHFFFYKRANPFCISSSSKHSGNTIQFSRYLPDNELLILLFGKMRILHLSKTCYFIGKLALSTIINARQNNKKGSIRYLKISPLNFDVNYSFDSIWSITKISSIGSSRKRLIDKSTKHVSYRGCFFYIKRAYTHDMPVVFQRKISRACTTHVYPLGIQLLIHEYVCVCV